MSAANQNPNPAGAQHDWSWKPVFQMNSCFVCNNIFVAEKPSSSQSNNSTFSGGSSRIIENLCKILEVQGFVEKFVPETNPLCSKCCGMIDEFFNLERQLQFLIKMLWEMRRMLGKKVVGGFSGTEKGRRNFDVKKEIYEVWRQKFNANAPPPLVSSAQLHTSLSSQPSSFASTLTSLNPAGAEVKPKTPTQRRRQSTTTTTGAASTSATTPDNNPSGSSNVLLDISNNNPVSSNNPQESVSVVSAPPENVDNENSNFSMECPSPSSPVGFDDVADMSGTEDVYVNNLPDENAQKSSNLEYDAGGYSSCVPGAVGTGTGTGMKDVPQKLQTDTETEASTISDKRRNRPIVVTTRRFHQCKFCGKLFPSTSALDMHVRTHTGEKPFKCSICQRPFVSKGHMTKHEKTHDTSRYEGEPQHECNVCGKKYHLRLSLYTHQRDHTIKRSKKKKRVVQNELKWPPKRNYKKKRYPKPPRPKREPKPRAPRKKRVRLDADGNPIVRRKRSPKPPSDKPKRRYVRSYPRRKAGAPKEPCICTYCGKDLVEGYRLRAHLLTHTGEKPYKCPICDNRGFTLKGNLDKHMRSVHEGHLRYDGEPSHICDYCGKAFYVLGTLYHHRRRHHLGMAEKYRQFQRDLMNRPADCKTCGEKFDTHYALRNHMLSTHQEKCHKCSICGRPFHTPGEAAAHADKHDPKFLYNLYFRHQCTACPPEALGFPSKPAVREHWALAHRDQKLPEQFQKYKTYVKTWTPKPTPPGPGQIWCLQCPEECRPRYRQSTSLRKHVKAYHFPNSTKRWKPNGEKGKKRKKKGGNVTEDELNTSSESESENESEDFNSDTEEKIETSPNLEPVRRSSRQTRGSRLNVARLLGGSESDNESEVETVVQPAASKTTVGKSQTKKQKLLPSSSVQSRQRTRISRANTKWTDSYIKQILKGREVHLILTRIEAVINRSPGPSAESEKSKETRKPLETSRRRPGPVMGSSAFIPSQTAPYRMAREGRVSPSPSEENTQQELEDSSGIVEISSEPIVKAIVPEMKAETEEEEDEDLGTFPSAPPSQLTTVFPKFPVVIHNPLAKKKTAIEIKRPPDSVVSAAGGEEEPASDCTGAMETDGNETVLGF